MNICNNTTVNALPFNDLEPPQQGHNTLWGMTFWKLELQEGPDRSDDVNVWDFDHHYDLKEHKKETTAAAAASIRPLSTYSVDADDDDDIEEIITPFSSMMMMVPRAQSRPRELLRMVGTIEDDVFTVQHRAINDIHGTMDRPSVVDTMCLLDLDSSSVTSDISMDDIDWDDDDDDDKLSDFYFDSRGSHHRGKHDEDVDIPAACEKLEEEDSTSILEFVALINRFGILDIDDVTTATNTNTLSFPTFETHTLPADDDDDDGLFMPPATMTRGRPRTHAVIFDPTDFSEDRGISVWNIGAVRGVMMMDNHPTIFRQTQPAGSGGLRQISRSWLRHRLCVWRVFRRRGGNGDPRSTFYENRSFSGYLADDEKTVDSCVDAVENEELDDGRVMSFGSRVLKMLGIVHKPLPLGRRTGRVIMRCL